MNNQEERIMEAVKARDEQAIKDSKNLHILKRLGHYLHGYWPMVFASWILCLLEVAMEVLVPFFSQYIVAAIESDPVDVGALWMWAGIMLAMAVCSTICGVVAGFAAAKASAGFGRNLRQAMYYKVQDYSFANIDRFSASSLVTRMTTDVTNVQFAVQMIMRMVVRAPIMMIAALILATVNAWPHWEVPVIFLCIIPFLAAVLFGIAAIVHPTFVKVFNAYDALNGSVQENLEGIRVVKSYGREDFEGEKFGRISFFIYKNFVKAETTLAFNSPAMQIAIYSATCLVSYFCGTWIIESNNLGDFRIEQITPLLSYIMMILNSLMMLSMVFVMVTMSRNSAERITQVLIEEPSLTSPENAIMEVPNGEVIFDNVRFKYFQDSPKYTLDDININIPSGSTVGIIGATGSAKTTLISLIARLYDVQEGSVRVGGHDVKEYDLKVLRDSVAVVLQKNVLFSGTIKSNLLWGNEKATDEEIAHAAHLACADEFVERFPDRYDSKVEQGGTNLSGGQKQRLCIARALLKNPKILILDDSTSAVDTATDARIRKAFKEEIPDTTKFIVAQRLLSIKDCDQILIMDGGKIVAHGTNDELMKTSTIYQELYETQLRGGDFDAE